jgi:hypothetical protein
MTAIRTAKASDMLSLAAHGWAKPKEMSDMPLLPFDDDRHQNPAGNRDIALATRVNFHWCKV